MKAGDGRRGLEGVAATTSAVSSIIEEKLTYRGYDIDELVQHSTFEETVYLLWTGELPTEDQLHAFRGDVSRAGSLPPDSQDVLFRLPIAGSPAGWLCTAVSALGQYEGGGDGIPAAIRILAQTPTLVAARHRMGQGREAVEPDARLPLAANFLYMLNGEEPSESAARALDQVMILHADHELNASTFTARVAASTMTDMRSAVVAALCALKGPLHGGAAERVYRTLEEIGKEERVTPWLEGAMARQERIMGFGHRVYRDGDPRARHLKKLSERLAAVSGEPRWYDVSVRLEAEVFGALALLPNVDFYSASVYTYLGIPPELFTSVFAMSRVAGWIAHISEQYADNRLIRPRAEYVGQSYRTYIGMENR